MADDDYDLRPILLPPNQLREFLESLGVPKHEIRKKLGEAAPALFGEELMKGPTPGLSIIDDEGVRRSRLGGADYREPEDEGEG